MVKYCLVKEEKSFWPLQKKKKKNKYSPPLLPLQRVKSRIIKNKEKESKKSSKKKQWSIAVN